MSFYELERAAQIIPHDASIQLHDGWVSFRRPGYQTVFFDMNSGPGLVEMAHRAAAQWNRYDDLSKPPTPKVSIAGSAEDVIAELSARERIDRRSQEQGKADKELFESVATLLWDVSLGLDREYLPVEYHPTLDWLESEAKTYGSKPWWEYARPEGWEHE